jgi:hypothetical protein
VTDEAEQEDARYTLAAWLYPRLLALITATAFVSIWVQLDGLVGDGGLAPVADLVTRLDAREVSFFEHPTLARFFPTASALKTMAALGVLASSTLFVGVLPRTSLVVAWLAYLSIVNAGFPFTAFQWDILLLEVLVASIFFVSPARFDRKEADPANPFGRWVLWLVLFRLMFRSGVVKLASGDPTWANLTALTHHYETQPLPTVFGWYAHQLPETFHRISCAVMFAIELGLPFSIFVPRAWARRTAAAGFASLMLLILLTGNYGFFNLLTLALTLTLVDDGILRRLLPARLTDWLASRPDAAPRPTWELQARKYGAGVLIAVASLGFVHGLLRTETDPVAWIRPFRSTNDYGLFAIMTTTRPEVEIEASHDGETWRPYRFRYKVGPLDRAPQWNTPHQPRLDWQMWFAALGDYRRNPWLIRLMRRLAARDPAVLALIEEDPFEGEAPPRFVRARLFEYWMTSIEEKSETGHWFRREPRGLYAPIVRVP